MRICPRILSLCLTAACAVVFCSCKSFWLYHPDAESFDLPSSLNIPYEEAFFRTSDGLVLNGRYVPSSKKKGAVLYCHGNGGNISWFVELYRIFGELGYDLFVFDYRGYGKSEGSPSVEGTYLDADAAWDYLVKERRIDPRSIVIWGRSMGGAVAAHCASTHQAAGFVAESSFTSLRDEVDAVCCIFPYIVWPSGDYETITYIKKIDSPVLVIHSIDDELVPFSMGQRLYDAAREPKTFLRITGSHNGGYLKSRDAYIAGIRVFLEKHTVSAISRE